MALHMCPDSQDLWFLCRVWSAVSQEADSHREDADRPGSAVEKPCLGNYFSDLSHTALISL